jgi:hypothetical protein
MELELGVFEEISSVRTPTRLRSTHSIPIWIQQILLAATSLVSASGNLGRPRKPPQNVQALEVAKQGLQLGQDANVIPPG